MVAHQIEVQDTPSSNDFIHHCSWLCVCRIARLTIGEYSCRDSFLHNDEKKPGAYFSDTPLNASYQRNFCFLHNFYLAISNTIAEYDIVREETVLLKLQQ